MYYMPLLVHLGLYIISAYPSMFDYCNHVTIRLLTDIILWCLQTHSILQYFIAAPIILDGKGSLGPQVGVADNF